MEVDLYTGSTYTRVNTVVFFKGSPFYGSPLILDRLSGRSMDWGSECFVNHPSKGINRKSLILFMWYSLRLKAIYKVYVYFIIAILYNNNYY